MIDDPKSELRERARRAVKRALRSAPPPIDEPLDPERLARLEAALRSLPRRRREIFMAVRYDALTYRQIAQRTGLSVERVEREFARALVQLHRAVHDPRRDPWWRLWARWLSRRNRP